MCVCVGVCVCVHVCAWDDGMVPVPAMRARMFWRLFFFTKRTKNALYVHTRNVPLARLEVPWRALEMSRRR